tara:strand:+ start:45463 stop:46179 length:717 start_codon:yes stop_codon:yes gene_type:complete
VFLNEYQYFYALEPRWFRRDRHYRIYLMPDRLCGAYIAGQIFDEQSAAIQLQTFYLFFRYFVKRTLKKRKDREARYDSMDLTENSILQEDDRNFHIDRRQVVSIAVNRKHSFWTPINVGTVKIELTDGSVRRFILIQHQNADQIAKELSLFSPDTDISGKSVPHPIHRKPQQSDWLRFVFVSFVLFGFALFFLVAAILKLPRMNSLLMAPLNLIGALYFLKKALKYRKIPSEDSTIES